MRRVSAPLAAIQRIGAGEVRVDRAVAGADLAAWDSEAMTGALSFGFVDGAEDMDVTREVTVANYGDAPQTLTITPSFRFEDDETNGAVQVIAPPSVVVPAADVDGPGTATFDVTLSIEAGLLRDWTANSGGDGANPAPFDQLEYDGYIELDNEAVDPLHLAWHVLPRQSGETSSADDTSSHHRRDRWDSVRRHHAEQRRPERHPGRGLLADRRELAAADRR